MNRVPKVLSKAVAHVRKALLQHSQRMFQKNEVWAQWRKMKTKKLDALLDADTFNVAQWSCKSMFHSALSKVDCAKYLFLVDHEPQQTHGD